MHPNLLRPSRARLAAAFLFSFLSLPILASAQIPPAAGHWEGGIQVLGHDLLVKVDLTPADGGWKGTIDIPEQGAAGLPLEKITVEDGHVRFAITGIPGNPTFDGTLENGKIGGTFTPAVLDVVTHWILERFGKPAPAARPAG